MGFVSAENVAILPEHMDGTGVRSHYRNRTEDAGGSNFVWASD